MSLFKYRTRTPFEPFWTPFEPPKISGTLWYCQKNDKVFWQFFVFSKYSIYQLITYIHLSIKNIFKVSKIILPNYACCSPDFFCLEKLVHLMKCKSYDKKNRVWPFQSKIILVFKNTIHLRCSCQELQKRINYILPTSLFQYIRILHATPRGENPAPKSPVAQKASVRAAIHRKNFWLQKHIVMK